MPHPLHPDDERLAAFAETDSAVAADDDVARHVSGCERCQGVVDELRVLQSALAELPDVAPSRPLRFLPPVEERGRAAGWAGWLRGLTAPAMGLAALLILVGAVGSAGSAGMFSAGAAGGAGAAAAQPAERNAAVASSSAGVAADRATSSSPSITYPVYAGGGQTATPQPPAPVPTTSRLGNEASSKAVTAQDAGGSVPSPSHPPFEGILGLGVVLLAAAFVTRGLLSRAGAA